MDQIKARMAGCAAGAGTALLVWCSGLWMAGASVAQASADVPALSFRVVQGEVQVGTESMAPYYLQWCTPMGTWSNWNENTRIDPGLSAVWFRGVFENTDAEDPMQWDPPADVAFYSADTADAESDGVAWSSVGMQDEQGVILGVPPADSMSLERAPVLVNADAPKNNQAVATPDPGRAKIYWRNQSSNRAAVWHLSDSAARKGSVSVYDANLTAGWTIAGAGDVNRDGVLDLVWHNTNSGLASVWFLEPDGVRSGSQSISTNALASTWRVDAVVDVDVDGTADLVWRNRSSNRVVVWFLNSDGTRRASQAVYDINLDADWEIAGMDDIDGDNVPDIVWRNQSSNRAYVWFLNANGTRKGNAPVYDLNLPSGWVIKGVADIDGDGPADIVWFNTGTRRAYIWFLNTDGSRKSHGAVYDLNLAAGWTMAGVQDVDADNTPDIVWFNTSTRKAHVWFLNANGTRKGQAAVYDTGLASTWGIEDVKY